MGEHKLVDVQTVKSASTATYTIWIYSAPDTWPKRQIEERRFYNYPERSDTHIHSVNCWKGGSFRAGTLKLRDARFTTQSFSYGNATCVSPAVGPYDRIAYEGEHGRYDPLRPPAIPDTSKVADRAWTGAYAKLNEGDYDFGATLGELKETIRTIISVIHRLPVSKEFWKTINTATSAFYAQRRKEKLSRKMANAWLEWRYGIRPLLWEAEQILAALTEKRKAAATAGKLYVKRSSSKSNNESITSLKEVYGFNGLRYSADLSVKTEVKAYTSVYYTIDAGNMPAALALLRKYGLSPDQGLALVWELTPLSFVVDWFVDIKTWIQALCTPIGITILGDSTSVKTSITMTRRPTGWWASFRSPVWNPDAKFEGMPGNDVFSYEDMTRQVNRGRPGLFQALTFNPSVLSISKWLDLLSLAITRVTSRR